jgi:hypothetical protein
MAAPVLRLRTPTGTGSERLPPKSANGSGANRRRGTRAAGRRRWRAGLPLVAITRVVARPKNKGKNKTAPQREKAGIAWASRWSGVTVRGDPTGCSASRWSAMGVVVLTAQNHFRLDRDRPSHGSRDRKGDGAVTPFSGGVRLRLRPLRNGRQTKPNVRLRSWNGRRPRIRGRLNAARKSAARRMNARGRMNEAPRRIVAERSRLA